MLATLILAAATALPLGVWPQESGEAAVVVEEIEFYVLEPEDDHWIVAVQPLSPPLERAEPATLRRLTHLAKRLGADAVVLLAELGEDAIPKDPSAPLPAGKRYSVAVFITFDVAQGWDEGRSLPGAAKAGRDRRRDGSLSPRPAAHTSKARPVVRPT